ncbi:hypothetical protein QYE76_054184 [Lolium multiflorum]|uniref:Uncharacterized protein n=1 Tax=Lolium multiflorum TaxID=4521 RepID=A0AAD8WN95_LOLMU|nr:hypothetical protein QYE76_054184 [Lolium multiflorum]
MRGIPLPEGEIDAIVIVIELDFIGIIITIISTADTIISTADTIIFTAAPRHRSYIEKTPFPAKMREYSVITSAVNKSAKKPIEPEEQIKVIGNIEETGAIGYTLDDFKGISSCQHAINMEDDAKLVVEHQRRLIPKMKDVRGIEVDRAKVEAIEKMLSGMLKIVFDLEAPWSPTTRAKGFRRKIFKIPSWKKSRKKSRVRMKEKWRKFREYTRAPPSQALEWQRIRSTPRKAHGLAPEEESHVAS